MADEFRTNQYWGSGPEGQWYKNALRQQMQDERFGSSIMNFVRYAVRYTLAHDESLKVRPSTSPGE